MGTKGYKSTEFWLSTAAMLVGVLLASGAFPAGGSVAQILGIAASVLSAMGYSASRAVVKKHKMIADIEAAKLGMAKPLDPSRG